MPQRIFLYLLCIVFLTGCKQTVQSDEVKSKVIQEEQNAEETTKIEEANQDEDADSIEETKPEAVEAMKEVPSKEEVVKKYTLPEGFVYVDDIIPSVELDIRYCSEYNFVGEKIEGYTAPLAILTKQAAESLKQAADRLSEDGYHIKIYDAYRPQKAVDHFVRWSKQEDASMKEVFYPSMEKAVLFTDGYISKKSRHSRGSTVDITIVDENGAEIDMGGYFDMLDTISNYDTDKITKEQHKNREYLKNIMNEAGFDSIRTEWWHFQLRDEPYKNTYFDFDVE